ncbi:MAG TPA: hypothetical protein VG410_04005 [Solirubrobacteraceae bacterium]|jgi:hypothetical protein|nr:hypothetical protein [Solirubrobacteraceae bacterium]
MFRSRFTAVGASALAAVALAACGTTKKPLAGTPGIEHASGFRGQIDDPRTSVHNHAACIQQAKLPVDGVTIAGDPGFQIGALPAGPTVQFLASPGAAQYAQISGSAQGGEVIGSALLFPNGGSDAELSKIESCLTVGVSG